MANAARGSADAQPEQEFVIGEPALAVKWANLRSKKAEDVNLSEFKVFSAFSRLLDEEVKAEVDAMGAKVWEVTNSKRVGLAHSAAPVKKRRKKTQKPDAGSQADAVLDALLGL